MISSTSRYLLPWIAFFLVTACANSRTGKVTYADSGQLNYERGVASLKKKDWVAAAKYFTFIRARFQYTRYATLAELRMADAEYGAENFLTAIDKYKLFMKFHPTHEEVRSGYVQFRIGKAYYKLVPDDLWILPPAHQMDQTAAFDAERNLKRLVKQYPNSEYRDEGETLLKKSQRRLAAYEYYVADYYWVRKKPMATVLRLRRLLRDYPGAGFDVKALWLLGKAYEKVDMPHRAKEVWAQLASGYPNDPKGKKAKEFVDKSL